MLDDIVNDVKIIELTVFHYLNFTIGTILFLVFVHYLNKLSNNKLGYFGIIPRHVIGLPGILLAPFLHGSSNHLFFNAIPLFALMNMVLIYGYTVFINTTLIIILLSGTLVWLFGRHAIHLGSSSVILGYFGFLSINAYLDPNFMSLVLIVCTLYYFGGLVAALVPIASKGVSLEGHIFGFLSGIVAYFCAIYRIFII